VSDERIAELLGVGADDNDSNNIFGVPVDALSRRLTADPWIESAHVHRRLPDTLVVEVTERRAAAVVDLGAAYLADDDGRVFKRADLARGEGAGLPVITGISRATYLRAPDEVAAEIRRGLDASRIYHGALTRAERDTLWPFTRFLGDALLITGPRPALGEVYLHPRRGLTFLARDSGLIVRVGQGAATTLRARMRAFDAAWAALSDDERSAARIVYADNSTRTDRVTVGFRDIR
jgi:cell division septal protein FtsQ